MSFIEFCLAVMLGAWLVESAHRGRWFPALPRLTPKDRKVLDAVRTLAATPAPMRIQDGQEVPRQETYQELQDKHFEELAAVEREIDTFGISGASFMTRDEGYTGPAAPEDEEEA